MTPPPAPPEPTTPPAVDAPTRRAPVRGAPFVDTFGRTHRDLRVSLTDRCSLRCSYCMPAEGLAWLPREELLTADELVRLVAVAVAHGFTSVRLTGGEPLLRPDVVEVVAAIAALRGPAGEPPEISLTTNGLLLPELAAPLAAAGLRRVNISLDTLRADRFTALTRRNRLADTFAGIDAARSAGLYPVKINAVLLRGINDDEAPDLLRWAMAEGVSLRFIEQMPLDPQHGWDRSAMVTADEILSTLVAAGFALTPVAWSARAAADPSRQSEPASLVGRSSSAEGGPTTLGSAPDTTGRGSTDTTGGGAQGATGGRGSAPAEEFLVDGGPTRVGIIGSITRPFCTDCDRARLTADGQWRSCLFARTETDLRAPLRAGADDARLAELMRLAIAAKAAGHGVGEPGFAQPDRPMSAIGG